MLYMNISMLCYLTLLSPPIVSWLLLSSLTLSYHAHHLRVDLGCFGARFEVHFGVHFDPPGDLPEGPKNGPKKHLKPGGPKHCKTAAGTPKTGIRVQGRKALANDASNNSVRVNIQRDTCCLVRLQNKHETYQCMHFLSPFCCRAVLLTPWSTQPPSTKIVRTLFAQISMAHRRMSLSYAAFSLTGLSYHFRHLLKTEKCY